MGWIQFTINKHTRVTRASKSCMDNILISNYLTLLNSNVVSATDHFDHFANYINIQLAKNVVKYISKIRQINQRNCYMFKQYLTHSNWNHLKNCNVSLGF